MSKRNYADLVAEVGYFSTEGVVPEEAPVDDPVVVEDPTVKPLTVEEEEEVTSPVKEALECNTSWFLFSRDPVVRSQIRYTEQGVEEVDRLMHPQLRARLYLMATSILDARGVRYDAQRDVPFYVRGLPD